MPEEMLRRNWAYDSGFGQVALAGIGFDLFRYFEDVFVRIADESFRARHYRFPTLIPAEVLGRCNYFSSFPHAITFATHLHGDYDVLEQFSEANKQGPLNFPRLDALEQPQYCLTPVVCYHCYRTLEGHNLTADEMRVFSAVGSCFRYESYNTTTLERLWDFTLREIVFVGNREAVKDQRQVCIDVVAEWLKRIGLRVRFETASDPFFTSDFSERTYFQLIADLKYEMRVNVAPDRTIAAGSFNLHNDFFGKTFNIRSGDGSAFSSCIGFGVERFVYAFVCQKGFDPANWPEEVRRFVKDQA
jgi:seryl-tRNA synthetase